MSVKYYFKTYNLEDFKEIMALQGETFRKHKNRYTIRIAKNNTYYFLKKHYPAGWIEIGKTLLKGHFPIFDAKREYRALQKLKDLGIRAPEPTAYMHFKKNPAKRASFLLTKEVPEHLTLEFLLPLKDKLSLKLQWQLIRKVGTIAGTMHKAGINHRDFYLCHLLLDYETLLKNDFIDPIVYVIDLHRAGLRKKTPKRWIIKDLAGLYFSSLGADFSKSNLRRFIKSYEIATGSKNTNTFWQKVKKRGDILFSKKS